MSFEFQRELIGQLLHHGFHDGLDRVASRPKNLSLHPRISLCHDDAASGEEIEQVSQPVHDVVLNRIYLAAREGRALTFLQMAPSAEVKTEFRILLQGRAR